MNNTLDNQYNFLNFCENNAVSQNSVTEDPDIEQFKEQWAFLDPNGTMFISEELLVKLVMKGPFPLGVADAPTEEGAVVLSK